MNILQIYYKRQNMKLFWNLLSFFVAFLVNVFNLYNWTNLCSFIQDIIIIPEKEILHQNNFA